MKPILTLPSAVLLTVLSTNMYAQNNKSENDYNLQKGDTCKLPWHNVT